MIITRVSPLTGKTNHMDLVIHPLQMEAYEKGALVYNAFPQLTIEQCEFIKTGITPEDWDAMFESNASE